MFIPILLAAIAVVGAVASHSAQDKQANDQINSLNSQNAIQAKEISDEKSQEFMAAEEQGRRQRALLTVAAGDAGINTSSRSVEAMLMDSVYKQENSEALVIKSNDILQMGRQAQAQSDYNQMKPPSAWLQALDIVSKGADAYFNAPRTPDTTQPDSGGGMYVPGDNTGGLTSNGHGAYAFGPPPIY